MQIDNDHVDVCLQVTNMLAGNMRLMELNTGRKARVITALRHAKQHLFQYQGYIGAYLLIGKFTLTALPDSFFLLKSLQLFLHSL